MTIILNFWQIKTRKKFQCLPRWEVAIKRKKEKSKSFRLYPNDHILHDFTPTRKAQTEEINYIFSDIFRRSVNETGTPILWHRYNGISPRKDVKRKKAIEYVVQGGIPPEDIQLVGSVNVHPRPTDCMDYVGKLLENTPMHKEFLAQS